MVAIISFHGSDQDERSLAEFVEAVAPGVPCRCPRGPFALGNGYTFFRRNPDRSFDGKAVVELARNFAAAERKKPKSDKLVAIGYSSGAIFASALLASDPEWLDGAVLLRPEPLGRRFSFPAMPAKPVLVLSGLEDERRAPDDGHCLTEQLEAASADVSLHELNSGHGLGEDDIQLIRSWFAEQFGVGSL